MASERLSKSFANPVIWRAPLTCKTFDVRADTYMDRPLGELIQSVRQVVSASSPARVFFTDTEGPFMSIIQETAAGRLYFSSELHSDQAMYPLKDPRMAWIADNWTPRKFAAVKIGSEKESTSWAPVMLRLAALELITGHLAPTPTVDRKNEDEDERLGAWLLQAELSLIEKAVHPISVNKALGMPPIAVRSLVDISLVQTDKQSALCFSVKRYPPHRCPPGYKGNHLYLANTQECKGFITVNERLPEKGEIMELLHKSKSTIISTWPPR